MQSLPLSQQSTKNINCVMLSTLHFIYLLTNIMYNVLRYTVRSKYFRTDFFKNRRHMRKTHTFFKIQNKPHWHPSLHRLLRGRTVSEKLPKIPLFGPSLIHQLRLLVSQQHPQSGVLLISFSIRGTENSLAEINMEGTGVIKGCNTFWGQKLANTCSFVGGRIIV